VLALASPWAARADEAPYVPSSDNVVDAMLAIAGVGPADYVIDLGSGDGRIPIAAAVRHGARGLGIENDPRLVALSQTRAAAAGVSRAVEFRLGDIFDADISAATVVTMYLLPEVNLQLRPRILYELAPGTRVVSHDFDMAGWEAERSVTVPVPDKTVGLRKESTIYLWVVPARIAGHWRGTLAGPLGEEPVAVEVQQEFQDVSATVWLRRATWTATGRLRGRTATLAVTGSATPLYPPSLTLTVTQGRIEGTGSAGDQPYVLKARRIVD
jgi:hypothetical protein